MSVVQEYRNWAGNHRYAFSSVASPTSLEQVQHLVCDATSTLTVVGSGHSFNAIADGATAISLADMPSDIKISPDRTTADVPAGLSYGAVAAQLADRGLAVHNLASLPHISVGGAIATATHGSGTANRNLAAAVAGLQLVTADGNSRTVRRGDADFAGYPVHLGALGVVTRVVLDVIPEFDVTQRVYDDLPWGALLADFDEVFASGYSVSVFTRFGDTAGQLWIKERHGRDRAPEDMFGAPAATVARHPIDGLDPGNCTEQLGSPGPSLARLPHFRVGFNPSNGDELQSEYHVPLSRGRDAIEILLSLRDRYRNIVQDGEFRTVAADDLWMSPQYGQDTLAIHFTWDPDLSAVRSALRDIEAALAPLDVRPHWGKVYLDATMADRFTRLGDFQRLRQQLDPGGTFANDWVQATLLSH
jgi:xylitol oxidase